MDPYEVSIQSVKPVFHDLCDVAVASSVHSTVALELPPSEYTVTTPAVALG